VRPHVLVARQDNLGDVLLAGPAVRAVAASAGRLTMLAGPNGRAAAELLPGVDQVLTWRAPWIDPAPEPVRREPVEALIAQVAALEVEQAVILTSYHQSPLPLALLLRLAGVPTIAAISEDYPGALLDVRHRVGDDLHEVERALSLAGTLGYRLPAADNGRLRILRPGQSDQAAAADVPGPYVVLHPGASASARTWPADRHRALAAALAGRGWLVAVTGAPAERPLTALVAAGAPGHALDLGGRLELPALAQILAGAAAVVVGNTGPAHLAAAVGAPVVSLFAPVVPATRWRPWLVPHVLLGDQGAPCAGSRATLCPVPGHPCLAQVGVDAVVAALDRLLAEVAGERRIVEAGRQ
jgi:ADP-heptose:LPS heptosyltransferase